MVSSSASSGSTAPSAAKKMNSTTIAPHSAQNA